jgi:hypothetical protein
LLVALADDLRLTGVGVNAVAVERQSFGDPKPGRQQDLDQRP